MKTIQQEWEGFWEMVKPKDASAIQMREMKKAFFSGALVAYLQMDAAVAESSTPEEEHAAVVFVESCRDEAVEFLRTMIREYTEGN